MKLKIRPAWIAALGFFLMHTGSSAADGRSGPSAASSLIECHIGDADDLFEINDSSKTIRSAQNDVEFRIIFYKTGILKFSSDNSFFAMDFVNSTKAVSVTITIRRTTGAAIAQVFSKDDPDQRIATENIVEGFCQRVQRRF